MSEQRFLVVKTKDSKEIKYFDYDNINGYSLTSKQNVKFADAIDVSRMIIINPTLIEKLIDKKVRKKFDQLINLISVVCEDNDTSGEGYYLALTETERFRSELLNKYKKYVQEEKLELILKKISILEDEVKLRLQVIEKQAEEEKNYTQQEGKSR